MSQKAFHTIAGTVFLVVAIVHFLRAINGWEANIHTYGVPMWLSWVAVVFAGTLAYHGLKRGK